jgi:hypothetical protein
MCVNVENKLHHESTNVLTFSKTPPTFISTHFLKELASGEFSAQNVFLRQLCAEKFPGANSCRIGPEGVF